MKKRIFNVLLALLAVSAAVSCGDTAEKKPAETQAKDPDSKTTEAVTEGETKEPSPYDLMETIDLEEMPYTIFDCNGYPDTHINMPGDSLTGELVNDALINRDTAIEDRFNVKISYYQENNINKVNKAVQAGDAAYDLLIANMSNVANAATANTLHNLREIEAIDLTQPCWSPLMVDALTMKDATYFTASDIAPSVYQAPCCMFLNLKLYTDYDIETDIYQLVLDGKWTLDELEKITHDMDVDVNGDSTWDAVNDFYGFAMLDGSETGNAFLAGAGISTCKVTDDGNDLILDIDNPNVSNACDRIKQIARLIKFNDTMEVIVAFKENRALFLQHKLESAAHHLRDMEADYLILPDPKYDEAQKNYQSSVSIHICGFTGIPATADPETSGYLTEALALYSNEYLRPIAFDLVYKEKDTRDPRSAEVLDVLLDHMFVDFASVYNFGAINDGLAQVIFNGKEFASTMEKRRNSANKALTRVVDSWNEE